jgi:hypothetical protein
MEEPGQMGFDFGASTIPNDSGFDSHIGGGDVFGE